MNNEKILIIDDNQSILTEISTFLKQEGYFVHSQENADKIDEIIISKMIDILILDIRLPGKDGITLLQEIEGKFPELSVIMISGHGDINTVIKAMRYGAFDYLIKPFKPKDLLMAVERTRKYHIVRQQLNQVSRQNSYINDLEYHKIQKNFIGVSEHIKKIKEAINQISPYIETNVMITGESGTGKEIVAKLIHYGSPLHKKPFIAVNCSAIPENLLESEFFGHVKGAFTGATENKQGYFELANGSTLFLDEIADMPLNMQVKLLRVIEEGEIMPVGSSRTKKVQVRIISATNTSLEDIITRHSIRNDLMHRLNTYPIHLLPLREHKEDIEPLLSHYLKFYTRKFKKILPQIDPEIYKKLSEYSFPGNVRELKNMVERAIITIKNQNMLSMDDLYFLPSKSTAEIDSSNLNLEYHERLIIEKALKKTNDHRINAAKLLGISRDALKRRLKKYDIYSAD